MGRHGLNAKTQRCRLGEVDAFVSHSWSDDPAAKWRVLQAWGAAFEERTGGGAIIWLDKACIDQTKIDDNLACLPVHLAGCKSLLVLAGPTYTKRLWCILEIFTFLKAGGGFDALELVPIAADADGGGEGGGGGRLGFEAVRAAFLKFSVEEARCYKEDERQHLLGVVETGFGAWHLDEPVGACSPRALRRARVQLEPGHCIELPPSPAGPPAARVLGVINDVRAHLHQAAITFPTCLATPLGVQSFPGASSVALAVVAVRLRGEEQVAARVRRALARLAVGARRAVDGARGAALGAVGHRELVQRGVPDHAPATRTPA